MAGRPKAVPGRWWVLLAAVAVIARPPACPCRRAARDQAGRRRTGPQGFTTDSVIATSSRAGDTVGG